MHCLRCKIEGKSTHGKLPDRWAICLSCDDKPICGSCYIGLIKMRARHEEEMYFYIHGKKYRPDTRTDIPIVH